MGRIHKAKIKENLFESSIVSSPVILDWRAVLSSEIREWAEKT